MKINSVSIYSAPKNNNTHKQSFQGLWGGYKYKDSTTSSDYVTELYDQKYYPFADESNQEIEKVPASKEERMGNDHYRTHYNVYMAQIAERLPFSELAYKLYQVEPSALSAETRELIASNVEKIDAERNETKPDNYVESPTSNCDSTGDDDY